MKRAPTNRKFADQISAVEEQPLEPKEEDLKPRGRPMKIRPPSRTGDGIADALNNATTVSEMAFEAIEKAIRDHHVSQLSSLLSVHNKALEARFMAESAYREEMERRNVLVDKNEILELCRRTMEPVLRRLKKLPGEAGPKCIGNDPLRSVKILELAVNQIISIGRKALDESIKS